MIRYRIVKNRYRPGWRIKQIEVHEWHMSVVEIKTCDTWEEAMADVQFLLNADRALNRMVNSSFN